MERASGKNTLNSEEQCRTDGPAARPWRRFNTSLVPTFKKQRGMRLPQLAHPSRQPQIMSQWLSKKDPTQAECYLAAADTTASRNLLKHVGRLTRCSRRHAETHTAAHGCHVTPLITLCSASAETFNWATLGYFSPAHSDKNEPSESGWNSKKYVYCF